MDATALSNAITQRRVPAPAVMEATLACAEAQAGLGAFPTDHGDVAAHLTNMEAQAPNAAPANVAGLPALAIPMPQLRYPTPIAGLPVP